MRNCSAQSEINQSIEDAGVLESELELVRGMAAGLTDEYARLGETARTAREDTVAAMTAFMEGSGQTREGELRLGELAAEL